MAWTRLALGTAILLALWIAYVLGVPRDGATPFNFFGYFTNLTNLLAALTLVACGALSRIGAPVPLPLNLVRGVVTSCMLVVGVIYNTLIPGTGSAPWWVSLLLHAIAPAFLLVDWACVGDRPPLPWRRLWLVLPYPLAWLGVVLIRGVTDGWVPYGFLLPSHGAPYVLAHVAGLLATLAFAACLVWLLSRTTGLAAFTRRRSR
ncbi:Pr6Pr family membrane protein [Leucobacter komagatae]|uniref:Pr6Pr family membrane protein n=1 Tax=Leucobacter komagatae TaxID=55969 RepID=UPI00114D7566|nr:Pr6Pr family membrane protein [Leucobacter komagatae]